MSREVALAQAWVRIAPSLRGAVMPLACDVDARVADACFPPLILLPLVEGAVAAGARAVTLSVRAMPREGDAQHTARISVSVEAGATPAAWTGERLDALRSIVATALRGATVAVARNGARAELEVAWHLEESVRAQPLSLGSR